MMRKRLVRLLSITVVSILLYVARSSLISKEVVIRSQDKLDRSLARYPAAVLLVYDSKVFTCQNKESIKKAMTVFRELSRDCYYRQADLPFFVVDISSRKIGRSIGYCWQLTNLPAIIVIQEGQPVGDAQGNIKVLHQLVNRGQLTQFIDDTIGEQLQLLIAQKDEDRQRRLAEARIQYYESSYAPLEGDYAGDYSWAYPYWGYGYGYPWAPNGYVGIGFGWGW